MKKALQLCSLAVNANPTTPGAGMVKVHKGIMSAYGGEFCIQVPVDVDIECAFNPESAKVFFRKERKGFTATIKGNKLELKEGAEKLKTGYLAPEEVSMLDCFGTVQEINLSPDSIKRALDFVDPMSYKPGIQGVRFQDGMLQSTDAKRLYMEVCDLPEHLRFTLPFGAAAALVRIGLPITGIVNEENAVKFILKDGVSLTSVKLALAYPNMSVYFQGDFKKFSIKDDLCAELLGIKFNRVLVKETSLVVIMDNNDEVEFTGGVKNDSVFMLDKKSFDLLVKTSNNFKKFNGLVQAFSEDCCALALSRHV
jgi:hypothetical protein